MKINNINHTGIDESKAARLQRLISAAQNDDKNALLQLCEDFKPLLQSEARREMFYKSLGRDAEGIAVLAFIELVLKYGGDDFINWPGIQRQVLQLLFVQDLKPAEAAGRLGCSVRNVTRHRAKGLDALRAVWAQNG